MLHVPRRVVVVFEDRPERGLVRFLRPGYRHCFGVVGDDDLWTIFDPLKSRIALTHALGVCLNDIVSFYLSTGREVLTGYSLDEGAVPSPSLRPMSCVEMVKSLIGVELPWAITPFQLHKGLLQNGFAVGTASIDQALDYVQK